MPSCNDNTDGAASSDSTLTIANGRLPPSELAGTLFANMTVKSSCDWMLHKCNLGSSITPRITVFRCTGFGSRGYCIRWLVMSMYGWPGSEFRVRKMPTLWQQ
ncbi:hypothetical protein F443_09919 [Phytophthora nicotianae P1569]|uniref:Uncharacterized protein n=1 Tax=Phytophthora nicotianae P1569 TaxID=1317065 RepID=V9F570_PHYNI|nr:hypothetical protein F443_09919 [Phytophthora nicotianae P1569]